MSETGDGDRVPVAPVEEFKVGDREIVPVGNREVGVFNVDGEFFAILNTCVHQHGPLCEGQVLPEVTGQFEGAGKRVTQSYSDAYVIKCPWHGWEYELDTGKLLHDANIALPTFDVIVEDGTVYLEI